MLLASATSCVPTPGFVKWEICVAYGPKPVIRTYKPDGVIVEQEDIDSDKVIEQTMHACRD